MRIALLGLLACIWAVTCASAVEPKSRDRDWIAGVVTRISEAERKDGDPPLGGTVGLRVRVGPDGTLDGMSVETSSGSVALDERALKAVQAAAPFRSPPKRLLSLEGYIELSFPLQIDTKPARSLRAD